MTLFLNFFLAVLVQAPAPAPTVVVGLNDGRQIVLENPEFTGFIYGRGPDALVIYRDNKTHGTSPVSAIARIDFHEYKRGPFPITITLKNGQRIEAFSERSNFVTVKGNNGAGTVFIKHPDPIATTLRIRTTPPNRKNDLTIQYLEFPFSTE
jgi:hypothetical protein